MIQIVHVNQRFLVALLLAFLGVTSLAKAIVPAPDGGYPGGNTAEGQKALFNLTSGSFNTAVGYLSLTSNAGGNLNTGCGAGTLLANTADENTAVGAAALLSNTDGIQNTANGTFALFSNSSGSFNTAIGHSALKFHTTGSLNTAIGFGTLFQTTTGASNTAIGGSALQANTTGSGNIALGVQAGTSVTTADNVIAIGASGENIDNTCYIGNIFNQAVVNGIPIIINSANKLGTTVSSRRFKEDIKVMNKLSEAIFALKPVTFRYQQRIDPKGIPQFGLVAEDVEKVNPDLVVRDKGGKPYSVRYDQVNAMLLNEFLKEHRTVQELKSNAAKQEATIAHQQQQIEALTAGLQKVSAQLQASKPAAQVVNNP
jgi:trimeric autotransporter adhesin